MARQGGLGAYLNGSIIPYSQAMAETKENESGSPAGFYDAERTFNGKVFKLREHLQRLYKSLEFAHIDPRLELDEIEASTLQVVEANLPHLELDGDFTVGQVVNVGAMSGVNGPPAVDVFIYCQPIDFSDYAHGYRRGVRIVTPSTYGVPERPPGATADEEQQETIPLTEDEHGNVTECRHANFMFVHEGRIKLPDRRRVLPGISMQTVVELAEPLGIPVDEDDYCSADIYVSDEAFVTGTRYCLLPVATLNGLSVGARVPGPITRKLLAAWSEMVGLNIVQQALGRPRGPETVVTRRPS